MSDHNNPSYHSNIIAELSGVSKRYGNTVALDGVDLKVPEGKLLAILGPNGAGKTTAISLLLGLRKPDVGKVTIFNKSPLLLEARRQVGVMMQEVTLAPEQRAQDLIDLTASYYPKPLKVKEVMELTNTTSLAKRPYGKMSGGQKRQVQFAMALVGRPKLLFLDEPTAGMDVHAREMMWSMMRQLVKEGKSIVLTTHYLEEAEALADQVVVLARGRIVAQGSVDEVRTRVARKQIFCLTKLSIDEIGNWPGVQSVSTDRQRLNITVIEAETIVRRLLAEDKDLQELEVSRAGLAEAFTEITQEATQ
jgi:ABC-2 type transport system ATP-binding protein